MLERVRLLAALVLPTALVTFALFGLEDVRWAFGLYVLGGCVLGPTILVRGHRTLPFRHDDEALRRLTGAPLAVLLFGPLFLLAYALLSRFITSPEAYLTQLHALGWRDGHQWLYFVLFVALVPWCEEWWWRGRALPRCEDLFGQRWGFVAASLGFASYHLPVLLRFYEPGAVAIRFGGIVLAALTWTAIAQRRRSWGWTFWAHLSADVTIVLAFLIWVAG